MAIRLTNASATPNRGRDGDAINIVFSARSTAGPTMINATYTVLQTPRATLTGQNPKPFSLVKKNRVCPNAMTLRLTGTVASGLYFIVIVGEDADGNKDAAITPLTIL
jgi:hypothetical protein